METKMSNKANAQSLTPERIEFLVGQITKSRDFYKAGQNSDCQRQAKLLDDTLTALAMARRTQAAEVAELIVADDVSDTMHIGETCTVSLPVFIEMAAVVRAARTAVDWAHKNKQMTGMPGLSHTGHFRALVDAVDALNILEQS